ncbi:MAG: arginine--tRNA ligase [Azospirillum sp.]|nr:arginine--tRNA ligase [Azospirillum sp.]MCZ8123933.1 arginine--tRNA ligase [Magnetospirillum sp.]
MNVFAEFHAALAKSLDALVAEGKLQAGLDLSRAVVEPPRDAAHGDLSTNAALVLAKAARTKPRDVAQLLADKLALDPRVAAVEIAGPGFVNLRLKQSVWRDIARAILMLGERYGDGAMGDGKAVNVEYVSANPTGPMHVGHCRGAVVGDALAALLEKTGHTVTREYYINDAGAQVDQLARSVHHRYREALGENPGPVPEGLYPGDYLKPVAEALARELGSKYRAAPEAEWLPVFRTRAVAEMMALIRDDLKALGVEHKVFTSEKRDLVEHGRVEEAVERLKLRDLVYTGVLEPPKGMKPDDWEPRPQLLFRATQFGDDVDRPLAKSDGAWTYFAADMAYHLDKYRRGFVRLIDVWGADHGGYVKRVDAAVKALSEGRATLEVKLCQMVNLLDKGEPVKMSKRAGTFVTLRDVVNEVGADVVRFVMLTRKPDQHLDFDFAKVREQSKDNPVFYVQYAHARHRSALRLAAREFEGLDASEAALAKADLDRLADTEEIALLRLLSSYPRMLEAAAEAGEPHRVAFWLYDLASAFHQLWSRGNAEPAMRFVVPGDRETTLARLALVRAVGVTIASGLRLLGVAPAEELR